MASCYSKCFYPCRIWSNVDFQSARRDNTTSSDRSMICTSTHSNECHNHHEQQGANDDVFRRTRKTLRVSICLKLTIFVGFLVVVAAGIPALILWLNAHERLVGEIERRLTTVCTLRQEQLRDYLESEMDKAHLISIRVIIKEYMANMTGVNKTMAESDLTAAVQLTSDFLFAACYDSEGHLAIATNHSAFKGTMDSKDLYAVQKSTVTITYPEKTSLGWMYSVSRAIYQVCSKRLYVRS
ncbi:hypothetical protein KP509_25G026700 [Ceratopteris richardii]|uniref:Uncharacterized protein n=1 Tax=Ceratopteris richardii TaxID=49495 RepID=A0A8T2RPT3_CERRI|nr:hypothetical protein KP509_25G026700 [Ceratopteris richardii]KAH7298100.1 hypothetical protein KP509_25G026700 [Ceratopteris richardii]